MSIQMILAPVIAQALLTLVVLYAMAWRRYRAVKAGDLRGPVALREANWPDYARQAEYNYQNQFELPVLFYLLGILSVLTRQADLFFVVAAWIFVATRVLHAFVHLNSNRLALRGPFFIVGAFVLTIMWLMFVVRFFMASA